MSSKPKRLGKGLGSLLKNPVPVEPGTDRPQPLAPATAPGAPPASHTPHAPDVPRETPAAYGRSVGTEQSLPHGVRICQISIASVRPNPSQPRRSFDELALKQLSDSISSHGLLQPIVVRSVMEQGAGGGARYELIAGERRWRAARMAGLDTIPALVREASDQASAELALIENLLREDLNVVERAVALRELCERYALTHGQAAERIGQDRSSVTNLLRLLDLDTQCLDLLASGRLSMGHGRALLGVRDQGARAELGRQAADEQWSVRELERRCKQAAAPRVAHASTSQPVRSAVVVDLEKRLGEWLGTQVSIQTDRTGKRGSMTFAFYGLEHFESLLQRLGLTDREE